MSLLSRCSGAAALLVVLASIAPAEGVRVVTPSGTLNFGEIQPAVDAAAEGDVLLVAEGSYGGFTVDGKSLSIFAVPGADVEVVCSVHVRNLAAHQTLVIAGLRIVSPLGAGCGNNGNIGLLWLENNQGFVRVQDCSFTGWPGTWTPECIQVIPGNDAAWVIDCARVALINTHLTGGEGEWQDSYNGNCDAGGGGLGLLAVRSNIALYDCGITGGRGGQAKYLAGDGGTGVEAVDSEVLGSGGWIQGGPGGLNYDSGIYTYATGGDALSLDASSAVHSVDSVVSGGSGQPTGQVVTGAGSHNVLPAQSRSLEAPTVAVSGTPLSATYAGVAGDEVSVSIADQPGQLLLLALSGVLLTPFPATWQGPLGIAAANGDLGLTLSFAPLGVSSPHGMLVLQCRGDAVGSQFLSSARHVLVLSPSVGPDCNGNGTSDYLDVITGASPDTNHNLVPDACDPSISYCTAGTSASGCNATLSASGLASASAPSGYLLTATSVEGSKHGRFFFGANGRQANPWGNGTSSQCVIPPVKRASLLTGGGTSGACDGSFNQDLNALWCPTCPKPFHNPGAGAVVQVQLWYRDPFNTSNQTTSLSDALEFTVGP